MKITEPRAVWNINLPEPGTALERSHLRQPPAWVDFLEEIEQEWVRYMRDHDAPQRRLETKIPNRFVLR